MYFYTYGNNYYWSYIYILRANRKSCLSPLSKILQESDFKVQIFNKTLKNIKNKELSKNKMTISNNSLNKKCIFINTVTTTIDHL